MSPIGYGRVSTKDQNADAQRDALLAAGCDPGRIYIDQGRSGKLASRPELDRCLAALQPGDTLVVTRLSRLARSMRNLLDLTEQLRERDIGLKVLKQSIDTGDPAGRLVFHIMAAIDEFQRELIVENTREGIEAARARGRKGGRPAGLDPRRVKHARQLYDQGETVAEIAKVLKVSRATVYRHLESSRREPAGSG